MKALQAYCLLSLLAMILFAGSDSLTLATLSCLNMLVAVLLYDAHRQKRSE